MHSLNKITSGGRSVSGGSLNPRHNRGNTSQAATYWAGGGAFESTGGVITFYSTYKVHSFTSSGVFTISEPKIVDMLVVGGGGGRGGQDGGNNYGSGGGGAGAMNEVSSYVLAAGTYAVTVGGGGNGSLSDGSPSSFGSLYLAQGGGGGGYPNGFASTGGRTGGSGGGGGSRGGGGTDSGGGASGPNTNVGGYGVHSPGQYHAGGGGGGAGGAGSDAGQTGGAGRANSIRTGSSVTYCVGGYGKYNNNDGGPDPAANSGSGASGTAAPSRGADGIVVVRLIPT